MTVQHLGSLTIGEILPGAAAAASAGLAGISTALPDLQGQLDALLALPTPTPIDLSAQITTLQSMITAITTQITLGIPAPSLATQLANIQALIASLQSLIAGINAQLAIINNFLALMSTAGIHAYRYEGQVGLLGAEMGAELGGGTPGGLPTDAAQGIVLLTTVPGVFEVLSQVMKVSP